jgi:heat shock protein HspQ
MGNETPEIRRAAFAVGQLVHHKRFDYRGVVVDVDAVFRLAEEWYEEMARSRPPRDRPWYHVLVHGSDQVTYVAERNLESSNDQRPIAHPRVGEFFRAFRAGAYVPLRPVS